MLTSINAETRPAANWQRGRAARDARIEAGSRLAKGKIVEARDATRLIEAVIQPGDRVCLEGDNQKHDNEGATALMTRRIMDMFLFDASAARRTGRLGPIGPTPLRCRW